MPPPPLFLNTGIQGLQGRPTGIKFRLAALVSLLRRPCPQSGSPVGRWYCVVKAILLFIDQARQALCTHQLQHGKRVQERALVAGMPLLSTNNPARLAACP